MYTTSHQGRKGVNDNAPLSQIVKAPQKHSNRFGSHFFFLPQQGSRESGPERNTNRLPHIYSKWSHNNAASTLLGHRQLAKAVYMRLLNGVRRSAALSPPKHLDFAPLFRGKRAHGGLGRCLKACHFPQQAAWLPETMVPDHPIALSF